MFRMVTKKFGPSILSGGGASKNYLLSTIAGTFFFFIFVAGLSRFTSLKSKLESVNLNTFKFVGGVINNYDF